MAKQKGKVTSVGAMQEALKAKGDDAANADLITWIKTTYPGVKFQEKYVSQVKNAARKQAAKAGKNGRKSAPVAAKAKPVSKPSAGIQVRIEDIAVLKAMMDRVGAEKIQQLAAILAK
jgi:hypothetical protein